MGKLFIDKETSPPTSNVGRRPDKAPAAKLPAYLPPLSQLICLILWGYRFRHNVDDILSDIISSKVKAWGMAGQMAAVYDWRVSRVIHSMKRQQIISIALLLLFAISVALSSCATSYHVRKCDGRKSIRTPMGPM